VDWLSIKVLSVELDASALLNDTDLSCDTFALLGALNVGHGVLDVWAEVLFTVFEHG